MHSRGFSRRVFLLYSALGGSCLALDAHRAALTPGSAGGVLTQAQAADVEAIGAQIVPSDGTPGAREAGVVFFIDRALATFFAPLAPSFLAQLAQFQAACDARHPGHAFAALPHAQQFAFLKTVDETPFFARMRMLTVLGLFTLPAYGGNRDLVGWKLLGFEDRHVFAPPFGYYDRNYPGFQIGPEKPA